MELNLKKSVKKFELTLDISVKMVLGIELRGLDNFP
jgi:hypothetical protein